MKIKKTNSNNSIKNYKSKKIIAAIMAATSIVSLASCKNDEETKDYTLPPEISSSTFVEEDNNIYNELYTEPLTVVKEFSDTKKEEITISNEQIKQEITAPNEQIKQEIATSNEQTNQEITEKETNQIEEINNISQINYKSNYDVFSDYDILKRPALEKKEFLSGNYNNIINEEDYDNRNYDWYQEGRVDAEKVYNNILKNNAKKMIYNDEDTKLIVKTLSEVIQVNLDFMKKNYPNYDLDLALNGIDNLTAQDYAAGDWICFMDYGKDRIYVNMNNVSDMSSLKYSMSHELFHLIFCKSLYRSDVIVAGCGVDPQNTSESPLYTEFLSELCVESYSYEAFNEKDPCDYWDNYMLVELLCLSTGKDKKYFKDCFVNNNSEGLINCFEDGINEFNYAYSIYDAIDIGLGYGDISRNLQFRSDFDIASVQGEALNYAKFNLYKNLTIRLTKEIENGKITKEEAEKQIEDFEFRINNIENSITWINSDLDNYYDTVSELDNTLNNKKNKIIV